MVQLPDEERISKVGPTPSPTLALHCGEGMTDEAVARLGACIAPLLAQLEAEQLAYEGRCTERFLELHGDDEPWASAGQPSFYAAQPYTSVRAEGKDRSWPDYYSRPLRTMHGEPHDLDLERWLATWDRPSL